MKKKTGRHRTRGLFAHSYTQAPDYKPVKMDYLSFLQQSVEKKVVPALKKFQRKKEVRAARARRLRVD